jgi:hypothetical protein
MAMFGLTKPKTKIKVLRLNSNFSGIFEDKIVENGHVVYPDSRHHIGDYVPIIISEPGMIGDKTYPLYVLKENIVPPADNINPHVSKLSNIYPEFKNYKIGPDMYKKLVGMQILSNLIKAKKSGSSPLWIFMGLIAGVVILYILVGMGYIHVQPF